MPYHNPKIIQITNARRYNRPYPNAAEPGYYIQKFLDAALAVATGMGTITIFFFLLTM